VFNSRIEKKFGGKKRNKLLNVPAAGKEKTKENNHNVI